MTRDHVTYDGAGATERVWEGFDPDLPIAGFYKMQLRSGGAFVGIRIWNGPPADPLTGEELDRSWRWQAVANDVPIDLERVWPKCADKSCSAAEYRALCGQQGWAKQHAPDSALANPHRRHDPLTTSINYF